MTSSRDVEIRPHLRSALVDHARRDLPFECCGLLVGDRRRVLFAVPARNVEESAVRFEVDPSTHVALRRLLRRLTPWLDVVGAYHSHPCGAAWPSPVDIAQGAYPDWLHLIIGLKNRRAVVRGFRIRQQRVEPVRLQWRQQPGGVAVSSSVPGA